MLSTNFWPSLSWGRRGLLIFGLIKVEQNLAVTVGVGTLEVTGGGVNIDPLHRAQDGPGGRVVVLACPPDGLSVVGILLGEIAPSR